MAFGSDFRVKYLMREIQRVVTERLRKEGLENPLRLRVFDDDAGDNEFWEEGGLTFTTKSGSAAGSGDGAWYVKKEWTDPLSKKKSKAKPVLVIEGTFGIETGNVGDAQKTKLSHVIELAQRRIHSGILMPKRAEYYTSGKKDGKKPPTCVKSGTWNKPVVMAALSQSEKWKSDLLVIDAYDKKQLEDLVYAFAKNQSKNDHESESFVEKQLKNIKCEMSTFVDKYSKNYMTKPKRKEGQLAVFELPMKDGKISKDWYAKIHSDDVKAFGITGQGKIKNPKARSRHRNEHRLLGNVQDIVLITGKKVFLLMPRWNEQDLDKLRKQSREGKGTKEFKNFQTNKDIDILTWNDIDFGNDMELKSEFKRIRQVGIDLDAKLPEKDSDKLKKYCLQLKEGLYTKKYRIKK